MIHLGDITKIHGDQIEPVDCITFGSPCQDLSMAGLRAGLEGKNSGLFTEAIKRALEEVAAEAQKDGYGFEYMRNIRDGSLEMRIFKGRFGERVTLPVREVVEHETSGTGHKLIFDTYFALKDQYERDEVWM